MMFELKVALVALLCIPLVIICVRLTIKLISDVIKNK